MIALLLGLALGVRHAFEPDHLAAVSTLVAANTRSRHAAWLGAAWGLGHSLALLLVGGALLLLHAEMPPWMARALELGVGVMLVVLGVLSLRRAVREGRAGHEHWHAHGEERAHHHVGPHAHVHLGPLTMARRPLLIGLIHGLAGSGALTAAAVAAHPDPRLGLLYMLTFAFGSILGMAVATGVAGVSLVRLMGSRRTRIALAVLAGLLSLIIGFWWGGLAAMELYSGQ